MGELVAWIIGWDLIIEYAVGNLAVAISWPNYFRTLNDAARLALEARLQIGVQELVEEVLARFAAD